MIQGKKIFLTAIEEKDLATILQWRNSQQLQIFFREHKLLNLKEQYRWFNKITKNINNEEYFFKIVLLESNEPVGVVGVNYINWINRNCQLSIYIGKEDYYIDDFGWAYEALVLLEKYVFDTLNLHKIYVEVYEIDKKKINFLTTNSYMTEAKLKEQVFVKGKYYSSVILTKTKDSK